METTKITVSDNELKDIQLIATKINTAINFISSNGIDEDTSDEQCEAIFTAAAISLVNSKMEEHYWKKEIVKKYGAKYNLTVGENGEII